MITLKRFAYAMTILAGTHMAASMYPVTAAEENAPQLVPIQWGGYGYGYGGPGYDGPPPYREGPGGYYEPNFSPRYYGDRVIPPEGMYTMRRWRWESNERGRYTNPPWAGRGW